MCEIGEGTLFNYFKTKSELFVIAFLQDFNLTSYDINIQKINTDSLLIEEIINIINFYLENLKYLDKKLIREFYSISYEIANIESNDVKASQINIDTLIMNSLEIYFKKLVDNNIIESTFQIKTAISCIYGCSMTTFNEFVYDDTLTYTNMMLYIENQVKFILSGNIKWKEVINYEK